MSGPRRGIERLAETSSFRTADLDGRSHPPREETLQAWEKRLRPGPCAPISRPAPGAMPDADPRRRTGAQTRAESSPPLRPLPHARPSKPAVGGGEAGVSARTRRLWKRLSESRSRPAVLLHAALRAFKMGVYFKVFITAVLVLRLASHSAQMQFPAGAVGVSEHARLVQEEEARAAVRGGGVRGKTLRLVVLGTSGDPAGLHNLLLSLDAARYTEHGDFEVTSNGLRKSASGSRRRHRADPPVNVSLDIWLFARSWANAMPVVFLPLAVAVFGPPRFDHGAAAVARDFKWRHGAKHIVAQRSEPDWTLVWTPSMAASNETVVLLDASRARAVAPTFYHWLSLAQTSRPDVAAYALDGISFPPPRPSDGGDTDVGNSVAIEALLPATAALSPSRDAWIAFLRWRRLRSRHFWAKPALPRALRINGYDWWDALCVDPTRAWFTQFAYEYQARILHPVLPDRQVLIVRKPGWTDGVAGAGSQGSVHLSVDAEVRINAHNEGDEGEPRFSFAPSYSLTVLKWGGSRANMSSTFGEPIDDEGVSGREKASLSRKRTRAPQVISEGDRVRRVSVHDLVAQAGVDGAEDARRIEALHAKTVHQLVAHGLENGNGMLALTAVDGEDGLDAAYSWLCNVDTLQISPPALAVLVRDERVALRLRHFADGVTSWRGNLPLVLALHTGYPEVETALVVRDVLDRGITVFRFSVSHVWLSDPMFYISNALSSSAYEAPVSAENGMSRLNEDGMSSSVDIVTAQNSKGEVSPSFILLRPTFNARFVWSELVAQLASEVLRRGSLPPHFMQKFLSGLLLGTDRWHARRFPPARWLPLSKDLFVDASWYKGFGDDGAAGFDLSRTSYLKHASRRPVLTNLGLDEEGMEESDLRAWRLRARTAHHWFVTGATVCDAERVRQAVK